MSESMPTQQAKFACKECGSAERTEVLMGPESPHYAKLVCSWCGRFFWWVKSPTVHVPLKELQLPAGLETDAEALQHPLMGSPKQADWAELIRPRMLKKATRFLPPEIVAAMRTIQDASWWIANRDARTTDDIRWPKNWTANQ